MSLKDLVAVRETITTPGGEFEVQGLTLEAIAGLMKEYSTELGLLFDGDLDFAVMIKECPGLVIHLIAYAAGEPDQIEAVKRLPFGVQLIAIKKIWELTAIDVDELGNLFRQTLNGLETLAKVQVPQVKKPSKTGSLV